MKADEIVKGLRTEHHDRLMYTGTARLMGAAADLIESLQAELVDYHHMSKLVDGKMEENQRLRRINENLQERLAASQRREKAARNELCLKCGLYHDAHNGACDGCRWKGSGMSKDRLKEAPNE